MSKISIYEVAPVPKLADKLIGTSVGGVIEDITYNFTLQELLTLFIPNIPQNTLQGVLDYGNTATQNINLTGTINTTNINVGATATILNSYLTGETHITGGLYDRLNSVGTVGQVLRSTGSKVEWYTIPTVIPNLQQVLTSGNTADVDIILDADIEALNINVNTASVFDQLILDGSLRDYNGYIGASGQVLTSTGSAVAWVDLPVYTATSPLSIDSITKVISIQKADATHDGYLSSLDWINFDGKQNAISLTTTGSSGASTFVSNTLNIPNYTLAGLGGVPTTRTLTINGVTYDLSANRSWTIAAGLSSLTVVEPMYSTGGSDPIIGMNQAGSSQSGYLWEGDYVNFNRAYNDTIVSASVTGTTTKLLTLNQQDGGTITTSWSDYDTAPVSSVFGRTGAIVAENGDYSTTLVTEGTNLYYLDSRARASISLTTIGSSGVATYSSTTGVLNIPDYGGALSGYVPTSRTLSINGVLYDLSADRAWTIVAGVSSVFGRTDNVVAQDGDYSLTQLSDVTLTTPSIGQVLKYSGTEWVNSSDIGLTSVGVSMPSAFTVSNSPLTSNGTIAITGAGVASQYVRGDGQLANFPTNTGGGSSVSYYLNGGTSQGTILGNLYYEMSKFAVVGTNVDFNISNDGYIANFITDAGDPALLEIPGGNWDFEIFFSASSSGGTPAFYVELYKYDGTSFTLIADNSANPEDITGGTAIDLYITTLAVPETTLTITDRLAIRVYVIHSGRTITLHTQGTHLCQIITTFSTGISALNGLTDQVQYFATGTSGTDFAINSVTNTHTFNLPTASATNRGALSTTDWTTFNDKIGGIGTVNYLPKFTSSGVIGNSLAYDGGSSIGINTNAPYDSSQFKLDVNGGLIVKNTSGVAAQLVLINANPASVGNEAFIVNSVGGTSSASWGQIQTYYGLSVPDGALRLQPSAGQVLVGTTTPSFFTLDVNGSFRTTGQITLGSTISNGTYSYTLPSATGTLALLSDLNGYVPTSRTLTINGVTYDLSADRSWSITAGVSSVSATSPLFSSGGSTPNITIQVSNSSQDGYLSSTDWNTFNSKQNALTNPVTGTGTTNFLPKFTGTSTIGDSIAYDGGSSIGINTTSPYAPSSFKLDVNGGLLIKNTSGTTAVLTLINADPSGGGNNGFVQMTAGGTTSISYGSLQTYYGTSIVGGALRLQPSGGSVLINRTTDSGTALQVTGAIEQSSVNNAMLKADSSGVISAAVAGTDYLAPSALSGYVPTSRTLTINGVSYDLSADRSWTITAGISSVSGTAPISVSTISGAATVSISQATSSTDGYLSSSDWTTFNNKVPTSRTLTINGTTYDLSADRSWTVSGSQWTTSGSNIYYNTGNVGINQSSPTYKLDVSGTGRFTGALTIGNLDGEVLKLQEGTSTGNSYLRFYSSAGSGLGYIGSFYSGSAQYLLVDGSGTDLSLNGNANLTLKTGGTERMRITSTGNVGIGTSTPTDSSGFGQIIDLNGSGGAGLYARYNSSATAYFLFGQDSSGSYLYAKSTPMQFLVNNAERMRITSGGNLLVGTSTDDGFKFKVNGVVYSAGTSAIMLTQARSLDNYYGFYGTSSNIMNFYSQLYAVTGQFNTITGVYTPISDINKKKDFEDSTIGLNAILGLKPTLYRMKDDNEETEKQLGFIAQEVKQFIPQAYVESGEGEDKFIGLSDRPIIAALVKSIQELEARLKTLENK